MENSVKMYLHEQILYIYFLSFEEEPNSFLIIKVKLKEFVGLFCVSAGAGAAVDGAAVVDVVLVVR